MIIDDAGQVAGPAAGHRAVHQVRGPDLVHPPRLEPAVSLRRLPAGAGGQLAGLEPPLDRPLRGAQPSWAASTRRTCAAVRAGFSFFSPTASSTTCGSVRGVHCRGAGTSASNPPARRAVIHRSTSCATRSPCRRTGRRAPAGELAHDRAALPRCQGRSIAGSISDHRHSAIVCARCRLRQLPCPLRHALLQIAVKRLTVTLAGRPGGQEEETAASPARVVLPASGGSAGASSSPPVRCAATSCAATVASPEPAPQPRGHRLQRRQRVPGRRPGRRHHPARGSTSGSSPASPAAATPPGTRTGPATTRPSTPARSSAGPPGPVTAAAAARPPRSPSARPPQRQRREDHHRRVPAPRQQPGRQQHVRRPAAVPAHPPPRPYLRRPANAATRRRRAMPHGRSLPPHRQPQPRSQPGLDRLF